MRFPSRNRCSSSQSASAFGPAAPSPVIFEIRVGRPVSEEEAQQLDQTELVRKSIVAGDRITVDLDGSGEGGIDAALCALLGGLLELGLPPREMREGASLEEAYLRITGDEASAELEE